MRICLDRKLVVCQGHENVIRTDEQTGGASIPVRCEKSRKSRYEVDASGRCFLGGKFVDFRCSLDHTQGIAKPLDGTPSNGY